MKSLLKKQIISLMVVLLVILCLSLIGKINLVEAATTYTVTFDTKGGSSIPSQQVKAGEHPANPGEPQKDGMAFYCWLLNESYIWNVDELEVNENITLVAKWVTWYSISCGENGKVGISDEEGVEPTDYGGGFGGLVYEGDTKYFWAKPDDGYVFAKWQNTSDDTIYSTNNPIILKSGETPGFQIEAVFRESDNPKFRVTFNSYGGSEVSDQLINKGEKAQKPINPTKNGFAFENWYIDEARSQVFDFNTPIIGNITLYAKWTPTTAVPYIVTFDTGGGSHIPNQEVYLGEHVVEPETPTKGTLSLYCWLLNGQYIWNVEEIEVTENITLVAKWVTWFSISCGENGKVGATNEKGVEPDYSTDGFGGLIYEGNTRYFWAKPNDGYVFKEWRNTENDTTYSKSNPIILKSGETPEFYVEAVFEKKNTALPFTDVKNTNWYYSAVKYVYDNKIMSGTGATTFAPSTKLSRSMMATILYNMEGKPAVTGTSPFSDVKDSSKWYYKAVLWAANKKIINGYNNGNFGPTDYITREQLAIMLYNYAKYKGKDMSKTNDLKSFSDANKVASWALTRVKWAVANGVITGSNGKLNPKGTATRAEAASMIYKYYTKVGK